MENKPNVIEKRWCTKCKATDKPIAKYTHNTWVDGTIVQYYMCRDCNADRHKRWYYNGNQKKTVRLNKRYRTTKNLK